MALDPGLALRAPRDDDKEKTRAVGDGDKEKTRAGWDDVREKVCNVGDSGDGSALRAVGDGGMSERCASRADAVSRWRRASHAQSTASVASSASVRSA